MSKLISIRPSKIHGTGVFAGVILPPDLWIPISFTFVDKDVHDAFGHTDCGLMPQKPFCYLNHSNKPNCEVLTDEDGGWVNAVYLRVLRTVRANSELTIDYGDEYWATK